MLFIINIKVYIVAVSGNFVLKTDWWSPPRRILAPPAPALFRLLFLSNVCCHDFLAVISRRTDSWKLAVIDGLRKGERE